MNRTGIIVLLLFIVTGSVAFGQNATTTATQVVMLGTGTPLPDPERAGPSTAIVVNDTPYIVDAGTGVVRRSAAARDRGVVALSPVNLRIAFLTHLHSDHTLGLPDLMIAPWIMGRKEPLELYGPPGTQAMVSHILEAYEVDRTIRTEGMEHSNGTGWKVNVHEIKPGVIFKDANVTVTAFAVRHGNVNAFGYRFAAPDRTVVISGDTSPTDAIVENCHGCDLLISEAYTKASFNLISPEWRQYRLAFHTSAQELGIIAAKAKPGLLILYHRGNAGCDQADTVACREAGSEEQLLKEIRQAYTGRIVAAHDLDVY
ncbi:MAG TPA: MBL fold metallo-hydrolase [Candidatus Acidoferrales bacterium]|nr:MBL fold metallo-hydrolase [Candidatus Acidoferrales bacterium]